MEEAALSRAVRRAVSTQGAYNTKDSFRCKERKADLAAAKGTWPLAAHWKRRLELPRPPTVASAESRAACWLLAAQEASRNSRPCDGGAERSTYLARSSCSVVAGSCG